MIQPLADEATLAAALAAPRAVLYKHSPRCGVCVASEREIGFFAEGHPEIPVYQLDVVTRAALSQSVAERLGVCHESPQVLLLAAGRVVWSASHWGVRAVDLEEQAARLATS